MRRMLVFTLAMTLATLAPPVAKATNDIHDWENVVKLKPNTPVMILLWNGDRIAGHLVAADDDWVLVDAHGRRSSVLVADCSVDRASVQWLAKIPEGKSLDARKWMLAGAAAGAVLTLVRNPYHGADGVWILRGLAGGLLGYVASGVAVTGVMLGGDLPVILHHRKVVYEGKPRMPLPGK